jgi:hypothetical protein
LQKKIIELERKYWDVSTQRKVYHFTIDESEGSTIERMEKEVRERKLVKFVRLVLKRRLE